MGTSPAADPLTRLVDDVVATIRALREHELFVRIVELAPELVLPNLLVSTNHLLGISCLRPLQ